MSIHYVYGAGQFGCLYDHGPFVADSRVAATNALAEDFDLSADDRASLAEFGFLALPRSAGHDYCEFNVCECDDPSIHQE